MARWFKKRRASVFATAMEMAPSLLRNVGSDSERRRTARCYSYNNVV